MFKENLSLLDKREIFPSTRQGDILDYKRQLDPFSK
jgi:hypothetical protein